MLNYTKTVFINKPENILAYVKGSAGSATAASDTNLGKLYVGGNSGVDNTVNTVDGSGKYSVNAKAIPTTKLVVKGSDELWSDANHYIKFLAKTPGVSALNAVATLNLTGLTSGDIYRANFYVRLRNNNSSMFSNNWTFKGKPFVVEFKGGISAANLVKQINKQLTFEYGSKLIKATTTCPSNRTSYTSATGDTIASDASVYFIASDQWQMFMSQDGGKGVTLEHLVTGSTGSGYQAVTGVDGDKWEAVAGKVAVNNGKEAFGDFAHVVKDLRLPTGANLRWEGIATGDTFGGEVNDDRPEVNTLYTQYTLQYDAERGIGQQTVLGGLGTTRTTHVFYVASGATAAFDAALIKIGAITDVNTNSAIDAADKVPAKSAGSATTLASEKGSIK